jgi:hypothetical protein
LPARIRRVRSGERKEKTGWFKIKQTRDTKWSNLTLWRKNPKLWITTRIWPMYVCTLRARARMPDTGAVVHNFELVRKDQLWKSFWPQ